MLIFQCFDRLVSVLSEFISFVLLIPTESSRSGLLKKTEDQPLINAGYEEPPLDRGSIPRPKGYLPGAARFRTAAAERHGEGFNQPHPCNRIVKASPEVRARKSVTETPVGLKGTQPIKNLLPEVPVSSHLTVVPPVVKPTTGHATISQISSEATLVGMFSQQSSQDSRSLHPHPLPIILTPELHYLKQIGGGGFGQPEPSSQALTAFEEEVSVLERLRHPNICLLLGVCWESGHRAIVTELVSRGSLWDALRTPYGVKADGLFFWPQWLLRKVLEGAGRGLIYLHSSNPPIIHRDLKSPNLLLDDSFNVKICDFGLARLRDLSLDSVLTANVGTVQWMAPEVLSGGSYNEAVDIYSMGLVAWEMMTGKCPYENMKQMEIALAVVNSNLRPKVPVNCSEAQYYFLQRCWATNPKDRYSAESFTTEASRTFLSAS